MATHRPRTSRILNGAAAALLAGAAMLASSTAPVHALAPEGDQSAPAEAPPPELLSAAELEELVGPIALYPDDLIALVLPASTYPMDIVRAARMLEGLQTDKSLQPDPKWHETVVALLNYPEVLDMMNADLDWTWDLGRTQANRSRGSSSRSSSHANRSRGGGGGRGGGRGGGGRGGRGGRR